MSLAQFMYRTEIKLRTNILGEKIAVQGRHIRPLSEAKSVTCFHFILLLVLLAYDCNVEQLKTVRTYSLRDSFLRLRQVSSLEKHGVLLEKKGEEERGLTTNWRI